MMQELARDPMEGQEYPSTEEEKDVIVEQVLNMLHSEEVIDTLSKSLREVNPDKAIETVAQIASAFTVKVVTTIEDQVQRDINPNAELGILAIVVEEMMTIGTQYGLQVNEEMVANTVQIASNQYNEMIKGNQGGPPPPQGQPQGVLG